MRLNGLVSADAKLLHARSRFEQALFFAAAVLFPLSAVTVCGFTPDCLAALILVPPWCWVISGMLTALWARRLQWRRMARVLVIFWLLFAGAWVEELPALVRLAFHGRQPGALAEGRLLRIVSLNCANTSRCLADLKRIQPGILLLQEAPGNDGLAEMARELFGLEGGFLGGGDTAILARWPIERRFFDRTYHFVVGSIVSDGGQRIECVSLRLAPPVSRLDVWSHGFWKEHRHRRQQHRQQLQQVRSQIDHELQNAALIVGGDFNTTPLDPALDVLRPELADGYQTRGLGWGATGTNEWPLFRVDQIWLNARWSPSQVRSLRTVSSDHRLVVCEAVLRK